MKYLLLAALLATAPSAHAADDRQPPQPHCLDARQIADAQGIDARTLALRLKNQQRFRLQLEHDCPAPTHTLSVRGAAGGWLCGQPGEALLLGDQRCPVSAVEPLDGAAFAELLRQRDAQRVETLETVEARAQAARGFRGISDYCVATDNIRSWSEDPQGLIVEVGAPCAAGNRYYRVELVNACPPLAGARTLSLVSGMGTGMVCGHPGDRIQLTRPDRELLGSGMFDTSARVSNGVAEPSSRNAPTNRRSDCPIRRVYPLQATR